MFLNNWDCLEDMKGDFWPKGEIGFSEGRTERELEGVEIVLASYGTPSYEGYAFVLFKKDGKLYEVNASHCSCYGLEGQWEPERTSVEDLLYRVEKGRLGVGDYDENPFAIELLGILRGLSSAPGR